MSALSGLKRWETLLLVVLLAVVALNGIESKYYWGVGNFVNLFQLSIEKSIVALTMALVIIVAVLTIKPTGLMGRKVYSRV